MKYRYEAELPMYFGAGRELFGLYHAVAENTDSPGGGTGVLLCPPLGQDQIRCHRLYRQLSHALVADGICTLRFDYFGTGDSAGTGIDVDWERCIADVVTAANELRSRSGVDRVVAFGARLGGNIAMAATKARFEDIVAWDPILDGSAFALQLDAMQDGLGADVNRYTRPRTPADTASQWLGFPVTERLRSQISRLTFAPPPAPMLVLDSLKPGSGQKWQDPAGHAAKAEPLEPPTSWDDLGRIETAILSHPLIQKVTQRVRNGSARSRS